MDDLTDLFVDTTHPAQRRPTIRWMCRRDLEDVLGWESCLPDGWGEADYVARLRERNVIGMVYESGEGRVLGGMIYALHTNHLELLRVVVDPRWRREGIGRELLTKLHGKLSTHRRNRVGAVVGERGVATQLFLAACGYRCTRVLRGHCGEDDAYRMEYRP